MRRRRHIVFARLLCATLSALAASNAGSNVFAANELRLAVIPVIIGRPETASTIASAAAEATALRQGLTLVSIDEYYFRDGGETSRRIVECGQESTCIARELRAMNVDLGLAVILNHEIQPPVLALILVRARDSQVEAERYDQLRGSGGIRGEILERMNELFDERGYARMARIMVTLRPERALLMIDGEQRTPGALVVKPGEHEISAHLEGHDPQQQRISARAGETTELAIELQPLASNDSLWLWGGIALAVVVAGTAIAFVVLPNTERNICLETMASPCGGGDR